MWGTRVPFEESEILRKRSHVLHRAVVSIVLRLINVLRDGERCRGTVRVSDDKETAAEVYVMRLRCVRDRSNRSISIYNSVRCQSNVWRGLGTCRRRMVKECIRSRKVVRVLEVGSKTF